MSTTPMHRPFLVGPDLAAGQNMAEHKLTGLNLVSGTCVSQNLVGRDMVYRGLHLVPMTGNKKMTLTNPFQNNYKIAAIAAALFLVLTVV